MTFSEMQQADFRKLGRSLESSMSLGDIMFLGMKLGKMTDEEVQEVVDKMDKSYLPSDYQASQNRSIVKMSAMFAL